MARDDCLEFMISSGKHDIGVGIKCRSSIHDIMDHGSEQVGHDHKMAGVVMMSMPKKMDIFLRPMDH